MKIVVAILVYDRFINVSEWIRCWKKCVKEEAYFVIIHNWKNDEEKEECRKICEEGGVNYIPRVNIGMDIGAFQDVCKDRLEGFPKEWDYLLWVTDDVLPMSKRFVYKYLEQIRKKNIGVVCMEISDEVKTHIRTTGFMITKDVASKLQFPADPIETKQHCYDFEHRSKNAFYEQIRAMGLHAIQVFPDTRRSYLWDTHIRQDYRRWHEHYQVFPQTV